ncbi:pathogenesis-related genes transcriptional activator [Micractinium conductrix]|uniref:Pathogenesis-related genes transcriptional activator n=1 Tax=Micractinium conductrix TaxID=554055 RepID=A0A2P6VNS6_9CHLO|nr:pathogenesis-related genes transcriptional activator [Micractinium conductrix]|eukprot:PSC75719.1 pathogenesis-related genes transcriptional activator [Micractinium conductrix]
MYTARCIERRRSQRSAHPRGASGQDGDPILELNFDLALSSAPPPVHHHRHHHHHQQCGAPVQQHAGMMYGALAPYTPLPGHLGCVPPPGALAGVGLGAPQQEGQQHNLASASTLYRAGSSTSGGSAMATHAAAPLAHGGGAQSLQQQLAGLHGPPLKVEQSAEGQGSHNGRDKPPLSATASLSLEGVAAVPDGRHDEALGPLSAPAPAPPGKPSSEATDLPAVAPTRRRTRSITQQEAVAAVAAAGGQADAAAAAPEALVVVVAPADGGKPSEGQGGRQKRSLAGGEGEEPHKRQRQRQRQRSPSASLSPSPSLSPPKPRRRPRAPAGGGGDAPERSSRYRGVTRHKRSGRFEAHIWVKELGRQVYLGGFEEEEQAAEAYDIMAIKAKGTAAATNFGLDRYDELLASANRMGVEELVMAIRRQSQGFSRGTSSYRGVTRHPSGRYEARIGIPGSKHVYLGLFEVEADAARAYDRALVRLRGRAAATNFGHGGYGGDVVAWEEMQARLLRGCTRAADVQGQHKLLEKWLKGGEVFDEVAAAEGSAALQEENKEAEEEQVAAE